MGRARHRGGERSVVPTILFYVQSCHTTDGHETLPWSRVFGSLTVPCPVENSPAICETRSYITVFTKPPSVPVLSQINPVHTLLPYFLHIHFISSAHECLCTSISFFAIHYSLIILTVQIFKKQPYIINICTDYIRFYFHLHDRMHSIKLTFQIIRSDNVVSQARSACAKNTRGYQTKCKPHNVAYNNY